MSDITTTVYKSYGSQINNNDPVSKLLKNNKSSDDKNALEGKVNHYNKATNRGTKIVKKGQEMDKNAFLKILTAELTNQDPMNAKDSTQYISQLAQFSSLEQMANLNSTMSFNSASNMVGKTVALSSYDEYGKQYGGTVITKGELMSSMLLCMDPTGEEMDMQGIRTVEPTFGLPAVWINNDQREEAEIKGLTVVDPTTVMVTHLTETIKAHCYELLGRQETKMIIDTVKEKYDTVVEELIPDLMTIGEVQKVLQSLLKEKVSIKDMVTILESLADNSRNTKDIEVLTEYVRFALARNICNPLVDENGVLTVAVLSPELEDLISNNIQKSMQGSFPAVDPETTSSIFNSIKNILDSVQFYDNQPVILVSPKIRPAFRRLIEMVFPQLTVLSLNEVPNDVEIRTEGVVTYQ
ncbi:FHIPEP family type III secretion protein [Clostridium botulinum]|nr:FHIPEP family type III secretion protein [Clostridium botulinum]